MGSKAAFNMTSEELSKYNPFADREGRLVTNQVSSEALNIAKKIASVLYEKYGADKVMLHGSLAKGNFSSWSDIDLAVWGISARKFYRAVAFATGVSEKWKVDVVDGQDCQEGLRESILQEGIVL